MIDGRDVAKVIIPHVWDQSWIPTTRPLSAILEDAIAHGVAYPGHGPNCSCVDSLIRELRLQVSKALPPDTRPLDEVHTQADIRSRLLAKQRVSHLIHTLARSL